MLDTDSQTINLVVKTVSDKYHVAENETSLGKIREMINNGDFTAEYFPPVFTANSMPTMIITEKGAK